MLVIKDLYSDISDCFWLFYGSKYIAVMEERQERIENLISHINEISTTIETLQKLESQLNRITNK